MPTGNAARYLEQAMSAQMPAMKQQQEGMRKYLQGRGQRVGAKGAGQQARQAVDVYATRSGDMAAKLGANAERMGQQQDQFDTQAATQKEQWGKAFEQQGSQFDARMKQQNDQTNMSNMMAMFEQTGWTPEMLESMGYGDSKAGTASFNRQIKDLGFNQPQGQDDGRSSYRGPLNAANNWGGKTGLIYG